MAEAAEDPVHKPLSQEIVEIFDQDAESITFGVLLSRISHKSFGVLLAILALPSALPLPAPGYAMPFGLALLVVAYQMIRERPYPWFPQRVLNREIHTKRNKRLVRGMVWLVGLLEKVLKPRGQWLYETRWFLRLSGVAVLLCAASMCTPIPLTNTLPSLGIFLIGMGIIERDALAGIGGIVTAVGGTLLSITIIVLVLMFGMVAVDWVRDVIREALPALMVGMDT
ncbi:MAG: exopolysaccharide biosynthesis protein [Candidatus Hydrogenedentota bacterium]